MISIITSLLRNCRPNQRTRLINKFTENDHEKVDRLLELHFKYLEKVLATNYALEEQAKVSFFMLTIFWWYVSYAILCLIHGCYNGNYFSFIM